MLKKRGFNVKQHNGDADSLIVSTVLQKAKPNGNPVILVGNDTDLMVMLISQASADQNIYMMFSREPLELYSVHMLKENTPTHSI